MPIVPVQFLTDANPTLGAVEVGVIVGIFMFGITTSQCYVYFSNFQTDSIRLKAMVTVVWLCALAHAICGCHTLYLYSVNDFGHLVKFLIPPKSVCISVLFTGIIELIVQLYFIFQVYVFAQSKILVAFSCILSALLFIAQFVITVEAVMMTSIYVFEDQFGWLFDTALVLGTVIDWSLSGCLVFFLIQRRSHSNNKNTSNVVDRIILYIIQTGVLTSLVVLAQLFSFFFMRYLNFAWLSFYLLLPGVLSNSFLARLNARIKLREEQSSVIDLANTQLDTRSRYMGEQSTAMFRPGVTATSDSSNFRDSDLEAGGRPEEKTGQRDVTL